FPGFYSSNKRGFRCALTAPGKVDQGAARIEINREIPVYAASSDANFRTWAKAYHYDNTPLDAQIVEVKDTDEWRREKITFNGTHKQSALASLYVPKSNPGPPQAATILPGRVVASGLSSLPA